MDVVCAWRAPQQHLAADESLAADSGWHGTFTAPRGSLHLGDACLELPDGRAARAQITRLEETTSFGLFVDMVPHRVPGQEPPGCPFVCRLGVGRSN